jgi:hypothetical protein
MKRAKNKADQRSTKDRRARKRILHPIAFCTQHGIFPATGIALGEGAVLGVQNCLHSCPICGAASEIIPGRYEAQASRLNLLVDSSISLEALSAIRELAEAAARGRISPEEAKRAAEKIHPKAGKLFDVANWPGQAKATLYAAIICAAGAVVAAKVASSPNQTVTINPIVVERVVGKTKNDLLSSTNVPLPRPRPRASR